MPGHIRLSSWGILRVSKECLRSALRVNLSVKLNTTT